MSLRQHLLLYHGPNWSDNFAELNHTFLSRPPLNFTVWPDEVTITGRPFVAPTLIANTFTQTPGSWNMVSMMEYYEKTLHYTIKYPNERAICFDSAPFIYYPAELIYVDDIENIENLTSPFTIVI